MICFGSDVGLMCFALFGLATVISSIPMVPVMLQRIGCVYLIAGSACMFFGACRGGAGHSAGSQVACLSRVLLGAVAVSLLNPLAWIESALVMGSLATGLKAEMLATFTVGALAGSLMKFSLLGFGARKLTPLFARSAFCRSFDATAAIVMAGMVVLLL